MKTIGKYEVIARIAGPGLVLAAVFALVLSGSSVGRAQANATSPVVPAAAPAKAAPAALAGQPVPPAKSRPGGTHEGVKVHGHWMIEVRSPDGKLISHTEFENSLQTTGQQALAAILWGFTPGDWAVFLDGASGDTQLPCTSSVTSGLAPCEVVAPGSSFASNCLSGLPAGLTMAQCFPTLGVGSDVNRNSTNVALAGTLIASNAGVITDVQTFLQLCSPSITPAVCASSNGTPVGSYEFTSATLPAQGSGQCGGANQISCAVNVPAAGDTINVSVTISFQ
jgi:hypothetical protein